MDELVDQVDHVEDDVLRLMFLTCHPALTPESRAALTLRLVGGLRTEEIARGFLVKDTAVGQRISRAKRTLAESGAMLGHGGIVVFDDTVDMARMARFAMEFCSIESCGKCTPCRIGSTRGVEAIDRGYEPLQVRGVIEVPRRRPQDRCARHPLPLEIVPLDTLHHEVPMLPGGEGPVVGRYTVEPLQVLQDLFFMRKSCQSVRGVDVQTCVRSRLLQHHDRPDRHELVRRGFS